MNRLRIFILSLAVLLSGLAAHAADEPPAPAVTTAPVVLDGAVLFKVRGALAFPAAERAQAVSERIAAFAADRSLATTASCGSPRPPTGRSFGRATGR